MSLIEDQIEADDADPYELSNGVPTDDILNDVIERIVSESGERKNYLVDIAGNLGIMAREPALTNLQDTLSISAHGDPLGGFQPDASSTNELSSIIRKRVKDGTRLTLDDIASAMGSATNSVKRTIIDACFAAGYTFPTVKRLFPNLEELIAPATSVPSSAAYLRDLTRPVEQPRGHNLKELSPFFRITPTSTNVIAKASDWLSTNNIPTIQRPLTVEESKSDKLLSYGTIKPPAWTDTNYSAANPARDTIRTTEAALAWQRQQYADGKRRTKEEIDAIEKETLRRIDAAFK